MMFVAGRRGGTDARRIGLGIIVAAGVLLVVSAAAYALQYVRGSNYNSRSSDARAEAYWVNSSRKAIIAKIGREYTREIPPQTFRILTLGTSQTWGAGAVSENETWPRVLEGLLNGAQRKFEVVNAGVSGLVSAQVLDVLRKDLASFEISAAIVNLSNNDVDTAQFRRNLDALVTELQARGAQAVLTLEPNSPEKLATDSRHGPLAHKHEIVRAVARAHNVPVIDLHEHLAKRSDAGFVWWDFVHLTSFGQRLLAEKLAAELPTVLRFSRTERPVQ
jgi:lysophospholipase L1-like esterase